MRLATSTPRKCSGCFGQYTDRAHVDFESTYDGPPIDQSNPRAGHVDWVILCSACVEAAYSLLPEVRDVAGDLRERIDSLESEMRELQNYADNLEGAVSARPKERQRPKRATPDKPAKQGRYAPREEMAA